MGTGDTKWWRGGFLWLNMILRDFLGFSISALVWYFVIFVPFGSVWSNQLGNYFGYPRLSILAFQGHHEDAKTMVASFTHHNPQASGKRLKVWPMNIWVKDKQLSSQPCWLIEVQQEIEVIIAKTTRIHTYTGIWEHNFPKKLNIRHRNSATSFMSKSDSASCPAQTPWNWSRSAGVQTIILNGLDVWLNLQKMYG